MAQRLACEFVEDERRIDVVYWIDEQGKVAGEAYFHGDDMAATIRDGEFFHPYHLRHYRLHVPAAYIGKSKDAILEVQTWKTLGRTQPKVAMV